MYDVVAQADGLAQQFLGRGQGEQSLPVFGVEQTGAGRLPMAQLLHHGSVEHHLHGVLGLLDRDFGVLLGPSAPSGLLLDEQRVVGLQVVDTPLQSQHLADEGGLEYRFGVGGGQRVGEHAVYVVALAACIVVKRVRDAGGQQGEGVAAEELHHAVAIGPAVHAVYLLVEQLRGKVTEQYGLGMCRGLQTAYQVGEVRVAVRLAAGGHGRHVD